MDKILKLIQQLTPRKDLLEHFFWGNVYMIFGFVLTSLFGISNLFIILPILFGLLKELYDYKDYGGFSTLDWLFTSLPPFLFLFINYFLL